MRLEGKVAVITGAAQGIGRATAQLFAREGAKVVVADIAAEKGEQTVAEIRAAGGDAAFVATDVEDEAAIRAMIDAARARYGPISILMNNAFWNQPGNVVDLASADWDKAMNVMVRAIYLGCKYAIPGMIEAGGGSIVNTASVHGYLAARNHAVYDAAKGAVINLTREIAVDYGPNGIRCNAICPGWIITGPTRAQLDRNPAEYDETIQACPLRRGGQPTDIANAALFLASDESSFVTGHALVVDGGLTSWLQGDLRRSLHRYYTEERPRSERHSEDTHA